MCRGIGAWHHANMFLCIQNSLEISVRRGVDRDIRMNVLERDPFEHIMLKSQLRISIQNTFWITLKMTV